MANRRIEERQRLTAVIEEWNSSRLDLFALSVPNEDLEFYGVMRFFYQDDGEKVSTKCVRVSSTATTRDVMAILIEKFRPDMRMLSARANYALYEVHSNGEERQLKDNERPLFVQLNWGADDREGRFLLRKEVDKTHLASLNGAGAVSNVQGGEEMDEGSALMKRKLSKREKKELKKKEKEQKSRKGKENDQGVAEKLYTELPESNFTRSISNPELVMRKRRELKLEKKLNAITDGGPDSGGTLKIYGNAVNPDVPYKTLLLSTTDNVAHVVRETLDKYGLSKDDPDKYCLVQVMIPPDAPEFGKELKERILDDDECPLSILLQHPPSKGKIMFQLRPRSPNAMKRASHPIIPMTEEMRPGAGLNQFHPSQLPMLVEINLDGKEMYNGRRYPIDMNSTEVGQDRPHHPNTQHIQLRGPDILPQHCIIAHTPGMVTITPLSRESLILVNGMRVGDTVMLRHGVVVQFGKGHLFRFLEGASPPPALDQRGPPPGSHQASYHPAEKMRRPQDGPGPGIGGGPRLVGRLGPGTGSDGRSEDLETTFDVDGNIETVPNASEHRNSALQINSGPDPKFGPPGYELDLLPAMLSYKDESEDTLLNNLIMETNGAVIQFKLAPSYSLYLTLRSHVSRFSRSESGLAELSRRVAPLTNKMSRFIHQAITISQGDVGSLSFWMANASELLHFMKHDADVGGASSETAQLALAETVQLAFSLVVECLQAELAQTMPAFLNPNAEDGDLSDAPSTVPGGSFRGPPKMGYVLNVLSSAMTLLRRCRVNAALTIQLFSKLFHFINHWLFNRLVLEPRLGLCSREWGRRLKKRLGHVEAWAEKQGLELAAECHLAKINQAVYLLDSPKMQNNISHISQTCDSLNSRQVQLICANYNPSPGEAPLRVEVVGQLIDNAAATVDVALRNDGRDVRQEEPPDLELPFLLPSDGYSCDFIKGMPAGLMEYLEPCQQKGLCRVTINPNSRNLWTVYMTGQEDNHTYQNLKTAAALGSSGPSFSSDDRGPPSKASGPQARIGEPEILFVSFSKVKNSIGLSIVAAKGEGQRDKCIYVKSVVPGGAASQDGRLQAGDQLIEVDGQSLVGVSQEKAAEMMSKTGQVVTLKIGKQGAVYHGLGMLLNQSSPPDNRAAPGAPAPSNQPPAVHGSDPKLRSAGQAEESIYDQRRVPESSPMESRGPRGVRGSQTDMRGEGVQRPLAKQLEAKSTPALSGARDSDIATDPYRPSQSAVYRPSGPISSGPQGSSGAYIDPYRAASSSQPDLNARTSDYAPIPASRSGMPLVGLTSEHEGGYGNNSKSMPNIEQASNQPGRNDLGGAHMRPKLEEVERQKVLEWQRKNQMLADNVADEPAGGDIKPKGVYPGTAAQRLFPPPARGDPRSSPPDPRPGDSRSSLQDTRPGSYQSMTTVETVPLLQPGRQPPYGPSGDYGPTSRGDPLYGAGPRDEFEPGRYNHQGYNPADRLQYSGAQPRYDPGIQSGGYPGSERGYQPGRNLGPPTNLPGVPVSRQSTYIDSDFPPPPPAAQLAQYGRNSGGVDSSSPPPPPVNTSPPRDSEYSSSLVQRAQPAFIPNQPPSRAWPISSVNTSGIGGPSSASNISSGPPAVSNRYSGPSNMSSGPPPSSNIGSQSSGPNIGLQSSGSSIGPQSSGPPVKAKKPPPPPAKPKFIPPDPVASAAASGGWSSGKKEEELGETRRRRDEEIRRLESMPRRGVEDETRLNRLRVEAEFDVKAAQAMQYDENDTTLTRERVMIRQPVNNNTDNRQYQDREPTYARVDRNWNQSQPVQSASSSLFSQPQNPAYTSGMVGGIQGHDMPPPVPSVPPPEDPDLPVNRSIGSALKQPADIAPIATSGNVAVSTKKSVTFNDSMTMQYSINRSYGSTSSESSYPQSPEQLQNQTPGGARGYYYQDNGAYPREGEPGEGRQNARQSQQFYNDQQQWQQQQPYQQQGYQHQQNNQSQQLQQNYQPQQPYQSYAQRGYAQQQQPQQQYRQMPQQIGEEEGGNYLPYSRGNQQYSDEYYPPTSYVTNNH